MNYCDQCETEKPTKACGRCFHAQYCSKQCQAKAWGHHKRCCYPLPRNLYENKENTILHKALEYNLFQEYQALTNNEQKTKLGEARQLLYQGIIECILIDPQTGDMPEDDELLDGYECATTKIKEAGILLNEINSMNNNFVFAFIPNEFHRDIDCLWDGIANLFTPESARIFGGEKFANVEGKTKKQKKREKKTRRLFLCKKKMESTICTILMQEKEIHAFRKAIHGMKDINSFITLQTDGKKNLRLCTTDHCADGSMDAFIPVSLHTEETQVCLASDMMYHVAGLLNNFKQTITISIHNHVVACFTYTSNDTSIAILKNCAMQPSIPPRIRMSSYDMCEFISTDLVQLSIALNIGSPITRIRFSTCGFLSLSVEHDHGSTVIEKHLSGFEESSCDHARNWDKQDFVATYDTMDVRLDQTYNFKFVKSLVNPLINSSIKTCVMCIPKSNSDPFVIKFLLTNDIYQYYNIYPYTHRLSHTTDKHHPQASLQLISQLSQKAIK